MNYSPKDTSSVSLWQQIIVTDYAYWCEDIVYEGQREVWGSVTALKGESPGYHRKVYNRVWSVRGGVISSKYFNFFLLLGKKTCPPTSWLGNRGVGWQIPHHILSSEEKRFLKGILEFCGRRLLGVGQHHHPNPSSESVGGFHLRAE